MAKIYIAYRRDDVPKESEDIYKRLNAVLGTRRVVQDIHSIHLGTSWRKWIEVELLSTSVLIVVIGPNWLRLLKERLDSDDDYLRFEIQTAIGRGTPIIPLLIRGASLPDQSDLPADIQTLPDHEGLVIHDPPYFDGDVEMFIARMKADFPDLLDQARPSPTPGHGPYELSRRRAGASMVAACLLFGLLAAWTFIAERPSYHGPALNRLLDNHCWIAYDPQSYDPFKDIFPSTDSIRDDLRMIKKAGFTGVVTFSSRSTLSEIPRLAKVEGLAVIMGVWTPDDPHERANARRQADFVDAYCLGHRYNVQEMLPVLEVVIPQFRARTRRPVTTSAYLRDYRSNERLCRVGDWIFPDMHLDLIDAPSSAYKVDILRDLGKFKTSIVEIAGISNTFERPLMVKTLVYPWANADGATEEKQEKFFKGVLDIAYDAHEGPATHVSFAFHCAFDCPWKGANTSFHPWDAYSGLIDADGRMRPAGKTLVNGWKR